MAGKHKVYKFKGIPPMMGVGKVLPTIETDAGPLDPIDMRFLMQMTEKHVLCWDDLLIFLLAKEDIDGLGYDDVEPFARTASPVRKYLAEFHCSFCEASVFSDKKYLTRSTCKAGSGVGACRYSVMVCDPYKDGTMRYVAGTFHTHPHGVILPSDTDMKPCRSNYNNEFTAMDAIGGCEGNTYLIRFFTPTVRDRSQQDLYYDELHTVEEAQYLRDFKDRYEAAGQIPYIKYRSRGRRSIAFEPVPKLKAIKEYTKHLLPLVLRHFNITEIRWKPTPDFCPRFE
tara:strand:- start:5931 stop:6782 length:852 start_codon:yes stop_codon:yes gene_type:complete